MPKPPTTVAALIAQLQTMPQDAPVFLWDEKEISRIQIELTTPGALRGSVFGSIGEKGVVIRPCT